MLITVKQPSNKFAADESSRMRCAIYARYSSDLQRPTSSEDQIRNCRTGAQEKGWVVIDDFIRCDEELTGRTMVGRDGLADLVRLAKQRTKPFDCILIDDTSRLGRYLPDVLRECDTLMHFGVFIYFVSDRLDSREDSFRIVHLIKGYGDERYSKDLGKKIHRGQEGCVRKGYTAGGTCFGYKNKYLRDQNLKGDHGEARVIGVEQEIIPVEAAAVMRIMGMRADGVSFASIAKALKAEGVIAPRRKYRGRIQDYWVPSSIKEITKNELYHGIRLWNRTQKLLNPADGTKIRRRNPQSEWVRTEVPHLRIVPDGLWERVQQVNRRMKDKIYGRRVGGLNRSEASRTYLFSGLMTCGICGGKFNVIIGGAPSKVRYGCTNHRFRDACTNKMTILRSRLEQQLISAISKNLLDARLEQQRIRDFAVQLKATMALEEELASATTLNGPNLKAERSELEKQAGNLVDAMAQHGFSPFLSSQLAKVEGQLGQIDRLLTVKSTRKLPTFTDEEIQKFLQSECKNFCELLSGDPVRARQEIKKHINNLILTPKETQAGPVLEVSGDVALFRTGDVLVESPMEGIAQHYTRPLIPLLDLILNPSLPLSV